MNYILRQIAEICDDSPTPRELGSLNDFQQQLDSYNAGLVRILGLVHRLQAILGGAPHTHVAGTLADLHIDICAVCGHDIREDVHRSPKSED